MLVYLHHFSDFGSSCKYTCQCLVASYGRISLLAGDPSLPCCLGRRWSSVFRPKNDREKFPRKERKKAFSRSEVWPGITLLTYLLAYCMEQSPWEANRPSASREIPRILWNPMVHYRITSARLLSQSWEELPCFVSDTVCRMGATTGWLLLYEAVECWRVFRWTGN